MTPEQINQIKQTLKNQGYTEEQANGILKTMQDSMDTKTESLHRAIQHIITEALNNDSIQKAIIKIAEKDENIEKLQIESQEKYHSFLNNLNIWQKAYSLIFILLGGGVIFVLGKYQIIGKETCQLLMTMIITLTVTDAISTFLKASKNDDV